jgi:hypothetical protein
MKSFLAGLILALAAASAAPAQARAQTSFEHVDRVVVFGDLHGDYGKFHDMLVQAGLVDDKDHWSGGRTHLVQLGDVPDRAADTRRILDLLMRLEKDARKAGGMVHALIGNHEAMNMEGDLRYTTPAEFAAFADKDSPARRNAYYAAYVAALKAHPPAEGLPTFDEAFRARFDAEHPLGWAEHRAAWSPTGVYGRWVLGHSALIRIDDAIYLHGGLGPAFQGFDIDTMDRAVIDALKHKPQPAAGPPDILWNEQGPLWYRGLAQNDEAAEGPNVAAIQARHGVRRIVLGHTKQYPRVETRFAGAVVLTDIAPPSGCPEPHAFLIKEGDVLTAVHRGQKVKLGTATYQGDIAALDAAAGCPPPAPATAAANPATPSN